MPSAPDLDLRMRGGDPSVWPRWNPGAIEAADVDAAWEEALRRRGEPGFPDTIRAYTHFAYCESSCNFCMYWHQVPRGEESYARHTSYLVERVRWYADRFGRVPISSAYFGGGTPTAPPVGELGRYLEAFSRAFEPAGEFTVEGHPNVTTREKIELLGDHGVNRLSMGLQSLEHEVLVRITRRNAPLDHLVDLVRAAHERRMIVNLDLILGLPGQSLESFRADVRRVLTLDPDYVTLYLYVPVKRLPDRPAADMTYRAALTDDLRRDVDVAGYVLADEEYEGQRGLRIRRKEPDGKPGVVLEEVYAQFDEQPSHTIPLGPGAYGHVFGRYWYREVTAMETLEDGHPRYFGTALDAVDECRTVLLDAIARGRSLDVARLERTTGVDVTAAFPEALGVADASGLLSRVGSEITIQAGEGIDAVLDAIVPPSPGPQPAPELDETRVELELVATRRDEGALARDRDLLRQFRERLRVPARGHQICKNVWVGAHDDSSISFHVGERKAPALSLLVRPPGSPNVLFSSTEFAIAQLSRPTGGPNELEQRFLRWLVQRMLAASLRRTADAP